MTTPEEKANAYGDLRWKGRRGYPVMKDDCVEDYLAGYAQAIEDLKNAWPSYNEIQTTSAVYPDEVLAELKRTVLERLEK